MTPHCSPAHFCTFFVLLRTFAHFCALLRSLLLTSKSLPPQGFFRTGSFTELAKGTKGFQVQNAFLKFTAEKGAKVTLTASAEIFSTGNTPLTLTATGETQYVAVNPAESVQVTLNVDSSLDLSKTSPANKLLNQKIYNLGDYRPITLIPGDFWKISGARFAAYFFNNTTNKNEWVSLTEDNGKYSCYVPSGEWENVIFCRMNPANNTNDWSNMWNQTADLDIKYGQYFHVVGWTDIAQWSTTTTRPTVSTTISNKYIFFEPSTMWKDADARFAVYSYDNNGNKWTDMQKVNDNLYYVHKSDLKSTIIFVRMNPGNSNNNWDNKWAQTADLTISNNNNKCKMTASSTSWGTGVSWSKITTF